jgi:predicted RNase H-like HicB family nuclease
MPERLKVQGDLFHGVIPEGSVYVGRAAPGLPASPYANPFKVGESVSRDSDLWPFVADLLPPGALDHGFGGPLQSVKLVSAEHAVACYSRWFFEVPWLLLNAEEQLGGRDLACWCKIGQPCHADWLLGLVADLVEASAPDPKVRPDPIDGGFVAWYPDVPGCCGQGRTEEEALADAAEALASIRSMEADRA